MDVAHENFIPLHPTWAEYESAHEAFRSKPLQQVTKPSGTALAAMLSRPPP